MPRPRIPGIPGGSSNRPHYDVPDRGPSTRRHPDGPDSRRHPDDRDPNSRRDRDGDDRDPNGRDRDGGSDRDPNGRRDRGGEDDRGGDVNVDVGVDVNVDNSGNGNGNNGGGQCTPGGGTTESSGTPLADQCDTEGITGAINKVVDTLRQAQDMFNTGLNMLSDAIAAVQRVTFGLIPWLDSIQASVKIAQFQMNLQYNAIIEIIEQLSAPWFIKCFGDKIVQGIGPKVESFDELLDPKGRASYYSWQGDAADKFFTRAGLQYEASGDALEGVMKFGQEMQIMGDIGINATLVFLGDLAICLVELIAAIVEIALVPVGTAVSIGQILAVVVQVLTLISIFVTFCTTASSSASEFIAAVENVPMSGQWPAGVA